MMRPTKTIADKPAQANFQSVCSFDYIPALLACLLALSDFLLAYLC